MGGCGLAYEYTLSKIASDILGNSVQQWAIVIAVMLFCMGLGAELQRYISNTRVLNALAVSQILLAVIGGYGSLAMLHIFSALPSHFALVEYLLISVIGTLIGFEIPLLTRINEGFSEDIKSNLARILKMDYIGALVGALFWVFLLFRYFSMIQTGLILGLTTLASTAAFLIAFRKEVRHMLRFAVGIALGATILVVGLTMEQEWSHSAEQRLYRDRIIFSNTSKYQRIVLTESRSGAISCYINGHLQFNSYDEHIYHENLVHPAMLLAPIRKRILILGGGDGLALREILKYGDVESVTLVDLDPAMTELAKTNEHLVRLNQGSLTHSKTILLEHLAVIGTRKATLKATGGRGVGPELEETVADIEIINLDAAAFVAQAPGLFDVILIDFPDPNSVELSKLYSQHFYGFVRKKLSADGILVQQSTSPIHAKEAFLCIGRTMKSAGLCVLPYHDNVPSFGEWGWWIGGRNERQSEAFLTKRLRAIPALTVGTKYLSSHLINTSLHFGINQLETSETSINTITNPRIYNYYLDAWQESR